MTEEESRVFGEPSSMPPPPPPLPAPRSEEKMSIALEVREAPPGWAFEGHVNKPEWDFITPPAGVYFFYGTLQDPGILGEVLGSASPSSLQPAHVVGYSLKLWGEYQAIVDGPGGAIVQGSAFEVPDGKAAERLSHYETKAYRPAPCDIRIRDGDTEKLVEGYVFKYVGNPVDLDNGSFDLDVWLRRMGRQQA